VGLSRARRGWVAERLGGVDIRSGSAGMGAGRFGRFRLFGCGAEREGRVQGFLGPAAGGRQR
jgi:hypothetical protein